MKKNYKKILLILVSIALFILIIIGLNKIINYIKIKNAKIEVILEEKISLEFNDKKKVSDFIVSINGTIIDDYIIDSTQLGKKDITFEFINDQNIKVKYSYEVNVIDTVSPVVLVANPYYIEKGSKDNLTDRILCGDNYDSNPTCEIIGEYDLNTIGTYPLIFKATDSSGNITEQNFNLYVYEPKKNNVSSKREYTDFNDVISNYKTDNTKIGIDVSGYQGNIDFEKIKNAGVEFIIIKVGGTIGPGGEYYVDSKFIQNIEAANKCGIDVGIYYFSYADSKEIAIKEAKWVVEQIKDYSVTLPIAFDWENWSYYNSYDLSFYELTSMAESFLQVLEDAGYKGILYSSKSYLEKIWLPVKYDIWLAHYINKTNYEGKYKIWQMCDNGRVNGIDGAVDINILYE